MSAKSNIEKLMKSHNVQQKGGLSPRRVYSHAHTYLWDEYNYSLDFKRIKYRDAD